MLYGVLAAIVVWGAILFALKLYLKRLTPVGWMHRTIAATGATIAVLSVIGVILYTGLHELLAENSILWSLS